MQRAFSVWPMAKPVVGEMEMHSVVNLANLQTCLSTFFPPLQKSAWQQIFWVCPNLSFWDWLVLLRELDVLLSHRARTSLSFCASALFSEHRRGAALSVKHRYYVASLILHASIVEITAQLLSLSCIWFHQTTVRLSGFLCRLTSWKGELVMYSY